ncbi:unnamed protein product [Sympodiomycopsis kandeliae]
MASTVDFSKIPSDFEAAVKKIRSLLPESLQTPKWGIICGSGLSTLGSSLIDSVEIPYSEIPGFSSSSVVGHKNSLAFGFIGDEKKKVPIVAALGRFHLYEGYSPQQCVFPIRVMKCLGIKAAIVTNASGGINPSYKVGDVLALHDHLSLPTLTALNPLIGHNLDFGSRFPPTSDAYDPSLRYSFFKQAHKLGLLDLSKPKEEQDFKEGTYGFVSGPTYESRAECRALQALGADCVGMSTIPEVIAARHADLKILALSLITNKVVVSPYFDSFDALRAAENSKGGASAHQNTSDQDKKEAANHEEVLEVGKQKAEVIKKLVQGIVIETEF